MGVAPRRLYYYFGGRSSGEFTQRSASASNSACSAFAGVAAFSTPRGIASALSRISLANTPRRSFNDCVSLKRRGLDMARSFPKWKAGAQPAFSSPINAWGRAVIVDNVARREKFCGALGGWVCGFLSESPLFGAGIDGFPALRKASANGNKIRTLDALRGCSSMVEQQPSKLNTRVRFPSPAPGCFLNKIK